MGMAEKLLPAFGYGVAFGTLLYMVGAVTNTVATSIAPATAFVLGFTSAVAVQLARKDKQ